MPTPTRVMPARAGGASNVYSKSAGPRSAPSAPRSGSMPRSTPAPRSGPPTRAASTSRPPATAQRNGGQRSWGGSGPKRFSKPKVEPKILFQTFFKSVGPRTYAAQVKEAGNGNHFIVLTEGKRDDKTGEVKKCRLFVYSEDFAAFFRMLKETADHVKANPVPAEVKAKRARYWQKQPQPGAAAR